MLSLIKPLQPPYDETDPSSIIKHYGYLSDPCLPIYEMLNIPFKDHIPQTRLDLLNIKEKKQKHEELNRYSFCSGNTEFIFADDRVYILDFKNGVIY
jgi:hypothetical protein